jgi:hypothetical protein
MDSPPAIHAPADAIDYDRVLRCILMLEGHKWSDPGGAYAFTRAAWREETVLPYRMASEPAQARIIARQRLHRHAALSRSRGVAFTPTVAFDCWFSGFEGAMRNARNKRPSDYSVRGSNLMSDPSFK